MAPFLALVAVLAATSPSDQFDLRCVGTYSGDEAAATPYSGTIHIDLAAKLYCLDECPAILPILGVYPDRLVLRQTDTNAILTGERRYAAVNRLTGEYQDRWVNVGLRISGATRATCEPAPFTPFPVGKF